MNFLFSDNSVFLVEFVLSPAKREKSNKEGKYPCSFQNAANFSYHFNCEVDKPCLFGALCDPEQFINASNSEVVVCNQHFQERFLPILYQGSIFLIPKKL